MNSWWADDYGLNKEVVQAIDRAALSNRIIGYSALATHVGGKQLLKSRIVTSLHVNLVEGRPVSSPNLVRSLVNAEGKFYALSILVFRVFLGLVNKEELRLEISSQYDLLLRLGYNISGIDTHQHTQAIGMVEEVINEISRRNSLEIRDYSKVKTYTLRGRACLAAFRFIKYICPNKIESSSLNTNARSADFRNIVFLSWEGRDLPSKLPKSKEVNVYIFHPGSKYDKVSNYEKLN